MFLCRPGLTDDHVLLQMFSDIDRHPRGLQLSRSTSLYLPSPRLRS